MAKESINQAGETSDAPAWAAAASEAAVTAERDRDIEARVFVHRRTTESSASAPGPRPHRLEPATGLAHPAGPLEAGQRHRRLGDRQVQADDDLLQRARISPAGRQDVCLRAPRAAAEGRTPRHRPAGCRDRGRAGRRRRSVTGAAPSRRSWFVPVAARLRTEPGTAMTSTERSMAACAVISEPPRSRLSTTTSTSLKRGDDAVAQREAERLGRRARRPLRQQHARVRRPRPTGRRAPGGTAQSGPLPTTAIGRPPSTLSTPRCAAPSMPLASPDTTATPAAVRPLPELEGDVAAGMRGVARADQSDPAGVEHRQVAAHEQHRRWLWIVAEDCRERRVARRHGVDTHRRRTARPTLPGCGATPTPATPRPRPASAGEPFPATAGLGRRPRRRPPPARDGPAGSAVGRPSSGRSRRVPRGGRRRLPITPPDPAVAARSRVRSDSATSTCSRSTASGASAWRPAAATSRSAIVRATRRMRW